MNRYICSVILVFASVALAHADDLPDAPTPKVTQSNKVWITETAILGGLYASDFTMTARGLGTPWAKGTCCRYEADPLYGRHPSNSRIVATTAAMFAMDSLVLRKTEHNRKPWVRWAGRAGFAYLVVDEARCIHSWTR